MAEDTPSTNWTEAQGDYALKRLASDADQGNDDLTNAYCRAMDHLIENAPAPSVSAVGTKLELARERYEHDTIPDKVLNRIAADIQRLADQVETPIATLHALFEASWAASLRIEDDWQDGDPETDLGAKHRQERASHKCGLESVALQQAILMQMPNTWRDAMILQYHVYDLFETVSGVPGKGHEKAAERERLMVQIAIESVFDFMASELPHDHEQIGPMFKASTMLAYDNRRGRTGAVD